MSLFTTFSLDETFCTILIRIQGNSRQAITSFNSALRVMHVPQACGRFGNIGQYLHQRDLKLCKFRVPFHAYAHV